MTREEIRRDALAELVNIAFGHAARPLSDLLSAFVQLSVPRVELGPTRNVAAKLVELLGEDQPVHVVRQAFRPRFRGEALVALRAATTDHLCRVYGMSDDENEQRSAVLETANILTGACVGKLSELLDTTSTFSPPAFLLYSTPVTELATHVPKDLTDAILIRTDIGIEHEEGNRLFGYLFIMLPQDGRRWVDEALDRFIENLG